MKLATEIDILRDRIVNETAVLRDAQPSGHGSYTFAAVQRNRDFIRGMIHAYLIMTEFKTGDSHALACEVRSAFKTAQKTFKNAKGGVA
jgi:hypothetical protein